MLITFMFASMFSVVMMGSCNVGALQLECKSCQLFGTPIQTHYSPMKPSCQRVKPLVIEAKGKPRMESPKILNRRFKNKFNGTSAKPRLSVFFSGKQLYAMLVDDQKKKCLFYGSTLQKSIRGDPPCTTTEAAERVGEELVKACMDLNIHEISSYDRNGFARGERMLAFEIPVSRHGFLLR